MTSSVKNSFWVSFCRTPSQPLSCLILWCRGGLYYKPGGFLVSSPNNLLYIYIFFKFVVNIKANKWWWWWWWWWWRWWWWWSWISSLTSKLSWCNSVRQMWGFLNKTASCCLANQKPHDSLQNPGRKGSLPNYPIWKLPGNGEAKSTNFTRTVVCRRFGT